MDHEPDAVHPSPPDSTRWSRILTGDREHLVERYRKPLFRWFRSRLPSDDIAEDATQDFFVRLLEKDILSLADPAKGKFRSLLYTFASRFLADLHRTRLAAKKGAGRVQTGVDAEMTEDPGQDPPEVEFDRHWFLSLVNRARRSVKEYAQERGQPEFYQAFHLFYFEGGEGGKHMPIEEIAARMSTSTTAVNNYLRRARTAYSRAIQDQVAEYCSGQEEYDEEMGLLGAFLDARRLHDAPGPEFPAE